MFHILPHNTSFRFHACGMIFSVVPTSLKIIELCTNVTTFTLHSRLTQLRVYCPQFPRGRTRWRDVKRKSRSRLRERACLIRIYKCMIAATGPADVTSSTHRRVTESSISPVIFYETFPRKELYGIASDLYCNFSAHFSLFVYKRVHSL